MGRMERIDIISLRNFELLCLIDGYDFYFCKHRMSFIKALKLDINGLRQNYSSISSVTRSIKIVVITNNS